MNYPFKVGRKKTVPTLSNAVLFTGLTLPIKIHRRHQVPVVAGQCLSQSGGFTGYSSALYRDWSGPAFWTCEHSQDLRENFLWPWSTYMDRPDTSIKCVWRWQTFESVCGYDLIWYARCRVLCVTGKSFAYPSGKQPRENVWKQEFPSRKDLKVTGRVFCLSCTKPANQTSSVMPFTGSFSPLYNPNPTHSSSFFLLKGSRLVRWIVFTFPCRLDSTIFFFNIV